MPTSTTDIASSNPTIIIPAHCVMIPFFNRLDQVAECLNELILQAKPNTVFLLIDDGSTPQALRSMQLQPLLSLPNIYLIHHKDNYGVAAARNSGIHWCRKNNFDIAIMIDSDCVAGEKVIDEHLRLHNQHPEAACIGARIVGRGKSFWAKLDGIVSWIHASPHQSSASTGASEFRQVNHPYHLATTNFSVKLSQLPKRNLVFDERLKTGEDCLLIRELRKQSKTLANKGVFFSATPTVYHNDRETMRGVFKHHYEWGHHQYFIQLGNDISPRCFDLRYRLLFFCVFLPLLPLFALAGSMLNCKALLFNNPKALALYPLIYLLWLGKGLAVLEAALRPAACLREGREQVEYEEAIFDTPYADK